VAQLAGSARDLLTCERPLLNLLGRLSGIATLTRQFVREIEGTAARIYDTRKTTPGWRRLEKYAVHCGGGRNHRLGLFDAVLIKDNHLAFAESSKVDLPAAIQRVRAFLQHPSSGATDSGATDSGATDSGATDAEMLVEIEVDTLDQLRLVLPSQPDIVLLDNMAPSELRQAVSLRNELAPAVQLEASGGVQLASVRNIASTGVERISAGVLTHSARTLDIGLDWQPTP
jgi:nicotinate-nucleotide pyrophosphorylase (carboxylating)